MLPVTQIVEWPLMEITWKWCVVRNTGLVVLATSGIVYEMTASVKARSLVTMMSGKSLGMKANTLTQEGQPTFSTVMSFHSLNTFAKW